MAKDPWLRYPAIVNVRHGILTKVFVLACFVLQSAYAGDALEQWQLVATTGHSLRGLAYKDGTFVGVGFSTNTVVSTDGTNWFQGTNGLVGIFNGLYAVTAGAGQFVAVGPNSVVLNSPDGLAWTRRDIYTNEEYWAVIYAGGQFVSVGFNSYGVVEEPTVALTSSDGINWQRYTVPLNTTARNVAYGNGLYVASGWPHSMYSTNGRDWTPLYGVGASAVAFGNGRFVMAGSSAGYVSTNGVNWTGVSLPDEEYYTAIYANGLFMFGNGDMPYALLAISTDGTSWTPRSFAAANTYFAIRDIIFVDGHFYLADQSVGRIWRSGRVAPAEAPALFRVGHNANITSLSFTTVPGFRYALEYAEDLNPTPTLWKASGISAFAESDAISVRDTSATNAMRIYRVRTE